MTWSISYHDTDRTMTYRPVEILRTNSFSDYKCVIKLTHAEVIIDRKFSWGEKVIYRAIIWCLDLAWRLLGAGRYRFRLKCFLGYMTALIVGLRNTARVVNSLSLSILNKINTFQARATLRHRIKRSVAIERNFDTVQEAFSISDNLCGSISYITFSH